MFGQCGAGGACTRYHRWRCLLRSEPAGRLAKLLSHSLCIAPLPLLPPPTLCAGSLPAPSLPAPNLGSWDMGAALRARQESEHQAADAAAAAAAAQQAAARPPPYCPPWAPQPAASTSSALVPAPHLFGHSYHSAPVLASAGGAGSSSNPFAGSSSAGFAYSSHSFSQQALSSGYYGTPAQQQQPAAPSPSMAPRRVTPPRPPTSPAEAKAQELMLNQLGAFNLHADTVSALKPSPRVTMQHQPAGLPLVAMFTPR